MVYSLVKLDFSNTLTMNNDVLPYLPNWRTNFFVVNKNHRFSKLKHKSISIFLQRSQEIAVKLSSQNCIWKLWIIKLKSSIIKHQIWFRHRHRIDIFSIQCGVGFCYKFNNRWRDWRPQNRRGEPSVLYCCLQQHKSTFSQSIIKLRTKRKME